MTSVMYRQGAKVQAALAVSEKENATLKARIAAAEEMAQLLREIITMQQGTYGNAVGLHLGMIDAAKRASTALAAWDALR